MGLPQEDLAVWLEDLRQALLKILQSPGQDAGFTEESIRLRCRELERRLLQAALQRQADAVPVM